MINFDVVGIFRETNFELFYSLELINLGILTK